MLRARFRFPLALLVASISFATATLAQMPAVKVLGNDTLRFEESGSSGRGNAAFKSSVSGLDFQFYDRQAAIDISPAGASAGKPIRLSLSGAKRAQRISPERQLPGVVNYVYPDGRNSRIGLRTWSGLRYQGIYPGVDLVYYGNRGQLEYDFVVAPQHDPKMIALDISSAQHVGISREGELNISGAGTSLRFSKPVIYQTAADGSRQLLAGSYVMTGPGRIGFDIPKWDRSRPLIIDPVLLWSEFINGSTTSDTYYVGAVDGSGNVYVAGRTSTGVVIEKIGSAGTTLVYRTILTVTSPLTYSAYPEDMKVDSAGNVYIVGYSNPNFPTTTGGYLQSVTSGNHAFAAVLNAAGTTLTYGTYLAGATSTSSFPDQANGLALDSAKNMYITGYTYSTTFPTTSGAYQTTMTSSYGGFVTKMNPTLSGTASLIYSTYLSGPTTSTIENSIAVDGSDNAYVVGIGGVDFPVTPGAFAYDGEDDAYGGIYVTKLNSTATTATYSAYLGYQGSTGTVGIAVDGSGDAYVTGPVGVEDFPTTVGAYQVTYPSGFVSELNPAGTALIYSTFLGGAQELTYPTNIAIEPGCSSACDAFITGYTGEDDLSLTNPIQAFNASWVGGDDSDNVFVTELNGTGTAAVYSTYIGGTAYDSTQSTAHSPNIVADTTGDAYVFGETSSQSFPVTLTTTPYRNSFALEIGAAAAAEGLVYPTTLAFPTNQQEGAASTPLAVTLRNVGSAAMTIDSITPSPASYSETNTCGASLAGGAECTINVTFTPASAASIPGTLSIATNGTNTPNTVTMTGTGVAQPALTLNPLTLSFTNQQVNTASPYQTVTVGNSATTALTFSNPAFSISANFAQTNNCGATLAQGATCTVNIAFLPTEAGAFAGYLSVNSNTGSVPTTSVSLSGNGVIGTPALTLSSAGLVFNSQTVGIASPAQSLYVYNTGDVPVSIFGISITGTGSTDYTTTGCVTTVVQPGSYCSVRVTFDPTASGTRGPATVTMVDSTTVGKHSFTVTGTAVTEALTLAIDPSSLTFAQLGVGAESAYYPVTVTNTGNGPIVIERAYTTGDFRLYSTSCVGTLRVGSTCTNYVEFAPLATGALTGTLVIDDNATGNPQSIPLSGIAVAAAPAALASPDAIDFGTQAVAITTNELPLNLYNIGNVPFNITSTDFTGTDPSAFQISSNGCLNQVVTPGRYCTMYLTFTPGSAAAQSATLNFVDAAGTQTVSLTGTGVTATYSLVTVPATLTFQAQEEHLASPTQYVYLVNTGTAPVTISTVTSSSTDYTGQTGCNGAVIQPNSNCYLGIALTPTVTTADNATLTVNSNATGGAKTITVNGSGSAALATMQLVPAGLAYPFQVVGTTSAIQGITVENNSASTVTSIVIATSGTNAGDFAISSNNCSSSLAATTGCSFYVSFTPGAAGARVASVTITDSAGTQTLQLAGYGVTATSTAVLVDSTLQYQNETIGFTSPNQSATFTNTGNTPLTITSVTPAGDTSDFAISTSCSTTNKLAAFSSCTVSATFTPTAAGKRTATAAIAYTGASGSPVTVNFSGTGVTGTLGLTVSPTTIKFPSQVAGTQSPISPNILLTNTGTSPVTISSIVLGGTNPADFAISNGCPSSLSQGPTGNTCNVTVTFTPAAAAAYTATVTITDNAGAATVVNISGTGVADTKLLTVTPTSLTFDPQVTETTSATQYITVTNTGNYTVTFTSVTITGNFALASQGCTGTIAPGGTCSIGVTFTPTSASSTAKTGTVTIADNSTVGSGKQTVSLSGLGIATTSEIELSQTAVVFDAQTVATASPVQLVYYYNQGNTASTISTGAISGTNATDFSLSGSSCATTSASAVAAYSYCYYRITFTPAAAGARGPATLTITDSDPGSPRLVTLSGTGISSAVPEVSFNPASLTFASQAEGTTSAPQNINLTNTGQASLTITGITLTGTDSGNYAQTNNCPATLAAGFSCNIAVTFSPIAIGSGLTAAISVTDNATGSPQTVPITGTGKAGALPIVTLSPTSLAFPNVPLNTLSQQTVTVTNTGTAALTFASGSITITGTVSSDFSETNTCAGTSVAVNGTCKIVVSFTPSTFENQTATVSLVDNAANSPQSVPITGNGAEPAVYLSPTTLAFGSVATGTTSAPQTVTVENYGNATLTISGVVATGPYLISANTCGSSLAAGSICTISVEFKPTSNGSTPGTLVITDNAGDSPQIVELTGTGT
jgi:hypothetical protein